MKALDQAILQLQGSDAHSESTTGSLSASESVSMVDFIEQSKVHLDETDQYIASIKTQ